MAFVCLILNKRQVFLSLSLILVSSSRLPIKESDDLFEVGTSIWRLRIGLRHSLILVIFVALIPVIILGIYTLNFLTHYYSSLIIQVDCGPLLILL